MKHDQIIQFLAELRNSHKDMTNIFLYGSCVSLFSMLKALNPEAVSWYNLEHVITEINGRFYDITGEVSNKNFFPFHRNYQTKEKIENAFMRIYHAAEDPNIFKRN